MNRPAVFLGTLLFLASAAAQAATPSGLWEGTLSTPNGDLQFVFNVHRDGDKWAAELDVPMQGVSGLPLNEVKVDGAALSFAMPGPGDPHYEGKLSEDGKAIAGTFNAGGQQLALNLKWKSEPRAAEKTAANTGDVTPLVGVWEGTLEPPGMTLRVRFNFVKSASGEVTGTFDSLDQGANGLPIASIAHTGDKFKLDMKAVGCTYEGTLGKDGSLTGTFSQAGNDLPLVLKKKS